MPTYTAWPDGDAVANALKGLKVWPASGDESPDGSDLQELFQEQCDLAADAVKAEFEQRTGRNPFLITRTTLAHTATNHDGVLQLLTPAKTIYSVTSGGTVIDSTTYWTQPATAALTGQPIEAIQFSTNLYSGGIWTRPNQIVIDADYGYSNTIPAHVWRAALNKATLDAIANIQGESDVSSVSEDGYTTSYDLVGPIDDKTRLKYWADEWEKVIVKFTRITC